MKLQGIDVCIETSLKEYGFAWMERENDFLFYYGIAIDSKGEYTSFDYCYISKDCNVEKEFDWVNWKDFLHCLSTFSINWLAFSLPRKIYDLIGYYGYENVFGTSYNEGRTYKEIRFSANRIPYKD